MNYVVIRNVKGIPYKYEQKSWREGKKVRTKTIKYLGPVNPKNTNQSFKQPDTPTRKLDTTNY